MHILCVSPICSYTSSRCVTLHMSVITQEGDSALMEAAREGRTEVVVELVKAGADVDMQDNVCQYIYVVQGVHNS